jgi:hypothetical protein
MAFRQEPEHYTRTALSDLQGAWENLREAVASSHPFAQSERLLFHIDEGMSWESVRHLERMGDALLLIRNIAAQHLPPEDVREWIELVASNLDEVRAAIAEGERL